MYITLCAVYCVHIKSSRIDLIDKVDKSVEVMVVVVSESINTS